MSNTSNIIGIQATIFIILLWCIDLRCRTKRDWDEGIRSYNRYQGNLIPRSYTYNHFWDSVLHFIFLCVIAFNTYITNESKIDIDVWIVINSILFSIFFFIERIPTVYSTAIYIQPFNFGFWRFLDNKFGCFCLISIFLFNLTVIIISCLYMNNINTIDDNKIVISENFDDWWINSNGWFIILSLISLTFLFIINGFLYTKSCPFSVSETSMLLGAYGFWKGFRKVTFSVLYFIARLICILIFIIISSNLNSNNNNYSNNFETFWQIIVPLTLQFWCLNNWFNTPGNRVDPQTVPKCYKCWNKFWYSKAVKYVQKRNPKFRAQKWEDLVIYDKKRMSQLEQRDKQRQREKRQHSLRAINLQAAIDNTNTNNINSNSITATTTNTNNVSSSNISKNDKKQKTHGDNTDNIPLEVESNDVTETNDENEQDDKDTRLVPQPTDG